MVVEKPVEYPEGIATAPGGAGRKAQHILYRISQTIKLILVFANSTPRPRPTFFNAS